MAEYGEVKKNKLKFKNEAVSKKVGKKKSSRQINKNEEIILIPKEIYEESKNHGGWWAVDSYERIPNGKVCFQHDCGSYLSCSDTGDITLGESHEGTDLGPSIQEIFTLVKVGESKYALKTCFERYISVNSRGEIVHKSEAIGPQETLEIVIEGGKVAWQSHNGYFLSYNHGIIAATSKKASSDKEIYIMRTNQCVKQKKIVNEDEILDPEVCELNYVKQFQSFWDHKIRITKEDVGKLNEAKQENRFYEEMLNRREKMKSDRYCK